MGSIANKGTAVANLSEGFRDTIRRYPYSNTSNPVDDQLRNSLEAAAKSFDANINPNYFRQENEIQIDISNDPLFNYDLSTKNGNSFKQLIKERIEATGLTVEKMGKRKSEGRPQFWFKIK